MVDFQCQRLNNRPACGEESSVLAQICWWCCMGALVLGLVLAYAWMHNQMTDVNYQIEKLKNENARLTEANTILRAKQATLIAPERIGAEAKRLGLVSPDEAEVRFIQAGFVEVPSETIVAEAAPARKQMHE